MISQAMEFNTINEGSNTLEGIMVTLENTSVLEWNHYTMFLDETPSQTTPLADQKTVCLQSREDGFF